MGVALEPSLRPRSLRNWIRCVSSAGAVKYSLLMTTSSATTNWRLQLTKALTTWQQDNKHPVSFYTEASIDLADKPELLASMVEANFMYVFLGIETPSAEALKGSSKFQNLRGDLLTQVNRIRESGLWVIAGFIVGFDSDDETIFERQLQFIDKTAITWAMAGVLQAPRYDAALRPHAQGRPPD